MATLYDRRQAAAADGMAAGKATKNVNASFSAFDYAPSKLDKSRTFMMDDYVNSGRVARKHVEGARRDTTWDVLQYQTDVTPFQPAQGFSETKFHSGFMRRQASAMPYLQQRVRRPLTAAHRLTGPPPAAHRPPRWRCPPPQPRVDPWRARGAPPPRARPAVTPRTTAAPLRPRLQDEQRRRELEQDPLPRRKVAPGPTYNVLTSAGMDPSMDAAHGERRHVRDHRPTREAGMYADAPGGRLRDSTSRFFCTPDQLPHRPARQQLLETDGLTVTKRTSTVIGVGPNPSAEIRSVGAREALGDSLFGVQRRAAGKSSNPLL